VIMKRLKAEELVCQRVVSQLHEFFDTHAHFADDRAYRSLANLLALVTRQWNYPTISVTHPQLMGTFTLTVESEPQLPQPPGDLPLA